MEQLLFTAEAGAERLSIGRSQMYELLKTGAVRSVKIGRLRRIPPSALVDYINGLQGLDLDEEGLQGLDLDEPKSANEVWADPAPAG